MRNEFALELAKGIEELSVDVGLDKKMLINQAMIILKRQEKDIDILQSIKNTKTRLEIARSRFNNASDIADIEEAALEITEAETRLAALRRLAKQKGVKSNGIEIAGFRKKR